MSSPVFEHIGIIAGNGIYPKIFATSARTAGVKKLTAIAFVNETDPQLQNLVDEIFWIKVGQLGKMINFFKKKSITQAIMVGQISPKNLFDLHPDLRAIKLLARLKKRNAETLFTGIADEMKSEKITLLPAYSYLEHLLAHEGIIAGPTIKKKRYLEDAQYAINTAKKISELDIGQSVIVKNGTVLAVEDFEGTDATILRGGKLGRKKQCTLGKVSKPNQDMRFDIPVIGTNTITQCANAGIHLIAVEPSKTLLLEKKLLIKLCNNKKITLIGIHPS